MERSIILRGHEVTIDIPAFTSRYDKGTIGRTVIMSKNDLVNAAINAAGTRRANILQ